MSLPLTKPRSVPARVRPLLRPKVLIPSVILAIIIVACVGANLWAPYPPGRQNLFAIAKGPSWHHLFGTDSLGRDVLSRMLYGGRPTLLGTAEGSAVFLAVGLPLGLITGYFGGLADRAVGWLGDVILSLPVMVIVLAVLSVFYDNLNVAMVTFGLLGSVGLLRVVRSVTLEVREELFITAARVSGVSHTKIIVRHVLPATIAPVMVQLFLFAGITLLIQASLAFLGIGISVTSPSWGGMVADAQTVIATDKWLLVPTGGIIAITILVLGLLGDAARDFAAGSSTGTARVARSRRRRGGHALVADAGSRHQALGQADGLLELRDISVAYPGAAGELTVVSNVSFGVRRGETVGIVGESGCGKSTVAMAILGLLAGGGRVADGAIGFDGQDLATSIGAVRGSGIGLVSQEPMRSLDPNFRVGALLGEVVRTHTRMSRAQARRRVLELLELVRIPHPERVARAYAHELSGGMAQRVAIAMALAGDPLLLVADEPTTALDVTVQAEILALLRSLQEERGLAVLLITHDWGVIQEMCERALVMYAGQVVEEAPVRDLLEAPMHPYTQRLLASNPQQAEKHEPLPTIPGAVPSPAEWPLGCRFQSRCPLAETACELAPIPLTTLTDSRTARCIKMTAAAAVEVESV